MDNKKYQWEKNHREFAKAVIDGELAAMKLTDNLSLYCDSIAGDGVSLRIDEPGETILRGDNRLRVGFQLPKPTEETYMQWCYSLREAIDAGMDEINETLEAKLPAWRFGMLSKPLNLDPEDEEYVETLMRCRNDLPSWTWTRI